MNKKTTFGSIFATFILISIAFVTPVHASGNEILETLENMAYEISKDGNIHDLITNPKIQELTRLNQDEGIESLLDEINDIPEFIDFKEKYEKDFNFLNKEFSKKDCDGMVILNGVNYMITSFYEDLTFSKARDGVMPEHGLVIKSSNGAMDFCGSGWKQTEALTDIIDFVTWMKESLSDEFKPNMLYYSFILIFESLFYDIFTEENYLKVTSMPIIAVSIIISVFSVALGSVVAGIVAYMECFMSLPKPLEKAQTKEYRLQLFSKISNIFQRLINFNQNFQRIMARI